jgi:collagenase-like PrtC family protease
MQLYIYNGQMTTYYITTLGELYNSKTKNWLKGQVNKNGYKSYNISIDGEKHRLYAHRMVAETYLDRLDGKNEVNHKDGNKLNNSIENLEWVSSGENKRHSIDTGLRDKQLQKVYCFDENKKLVCTYESIRSCARLLHINTSWLIEQLNRKEKTLSHGFYWSRTPDNDFKIIETRIQPKAKKVGQFNNDDKLVEIYANLTDAGRKTGYDRHRISECCNEKIKTYKGFKWKFLV